MQKTLSSDHFLKGPILPALFKLALPLTASSMSNMLLNMVNTFWIGKLGASAVAAVGTVSLILWFTEAIVLLARVGAQVFTAQALGKNDIDEAKDFAKGTLQLSYFLGTIVCLATFCFAPQCIAFFKLSNTETQNFAILYLRIFSLGIPLTYATRVYMALATTLGQSHLCLIYVLYGTIANLLLAPLFLLVFQMGIGGAALASLCAQILMLFLFAHKMKDSLLLQNTKIFSKQIAWHTFLPSLRLGFPAMMETMFLSLIAMYIGRLVSRFGDHGIAIQRLGAQIESISWQTTEGFSLAVSSFIAQNYGAKQNERIKKTYFLALGILTLLSCLTSFILYQYGTALFAFFVSDEKMISGGADYLRILSYSQILMCIEILSIYAFYGVGKTLLPSVIVILFTLARIPIAHLYIDVLGADMQGIWWTLTHSSNIKGILLFIAFILFLSKLNKTSRETHL